MRVPRRSDRAANPRERRTRAKQRSPGAGVVTDVAGSGSYERIYAAVRRIPRGQVVTYGGVAELAGLPRRARLAGYALAALHPSTNVPWHRVVGAGGRLSLMRRSPDAALTQRIRLENEGVRFDARGRVDLQALFRPRRRAKAAGVKPSRLAPSPRGSSSATSADAPRAGAARRRVPSARLRRASR